MVCALKPPVITLLLLLLVLIADGAAAALPLPLSVKGLAVDLPIFSVFALPGEDVVVGLDEGKGVGVRIESATAVVSGVVSNGLWIKAPLQHGIYPLEITTSDGQFSTRLNVIVLLPFDELEAGFLNGYRIGEYPQPNPKHIELYRVPAGFVEVTDANRKTRLSPHFTLEQFLCKQQSAYPKYLVLRESLLALLEALLPELRREGHAVETFGFISGYRTPWYNQTIGNVKYSRHVYGDAADIFVDVDGDGRHDDLDRGGSSDRKDVEILFNVVEQFKLRLSDGEYTGGIGHYTRNSRHGGFVHVDTRGYKARW